MFLLKENVIQLVHFNHPFETVVEMNKSTKLKFRCVALTPCRGLATCPGRTRRWAPWMDGCHHFWQFSAREANLKQQWLHQLIQTLPLGDRLRDFLLSEGHSLLLLGEKLLLLPRRSSASKERERTVRRRKQTNETMMIFHWYSFWAWTAAV